LAVETGFTAEAAAAFAAAEAAAISGAGGVAVAGGGGATILYLTMRMNSDVSEVSETPPDAKEIIIDSEQFPESHSTLRNLAPQIDRFRSIDRRGSESRDAMSASLEPIPEPVL